MSDLQITMNILLKEKNRKFNDNRNIVESFRKKYS